jgi:hypothetical protein
MKTQKMKTPSTDTTPVTKALVWEEMVMLRSQIYELSNMTTKQLEEKCRVAFPGSVIDIALLGVVKQGTPRECYIRCLSMKLIQEAMSILDVE